MAGRRTRLKPEIAQKIINALRGGSTKLAAIGSVGVPESTFYGWLERGERARSGRFLEFSESVKKAEADAAIRNATLVQKAAMGVDVLEKTTRTMPNGSIVVTEKKSQPQWQAAAWWLERKFPDEWGRRERIDHQLPDGPLWQQNNYILIEDRGGRIDRRSIDVPKEPPNEHD